MKNEEQETTQTIERDDVFEALRDIGEKTTIRDLGTSLGIENLLQLNNLVKKMAADGELRFEFNDDDVREYWINDEIEEPRPESTETTPAEELSRSEKILAAIDARYCTLSQIKSYIGVHHGVDISVDMDELEHSHVIERDYNGEVTGFFRQGQIPAKWWITGDGTIGVEEIGTNADAPHPFADRIGREEVPPKNAIDLKSTFKQNRLKDVTALDVEEAFAEAGTVEASAEILKMSRSTLEAKMSAQPELKDAAKRGRAMFYEQNPDRRPSKPQAPVEEKVMETTIETTEESPQTGSGRTIEYTPEQVEELAAIHGNRGDVAKVLGYGGDYAATGFGTAMRRREGIKEAFERGMARFAEGKEAPQEPKSNRRETIILTPEQVEEAAAEFKTQLKTAKALGFNIVHGPKAFRQRLQKHPDLMAAYERGVERFKVKKAEAASEPLPETTPEPLDELPTPETHATESAEAEAPISPESVEPSRPSEELSATEDHAIATAEPETTPSPESKTVEGRDESESEDTPRFETAEERSLPLNVCPDCKFPYGTYEEAMECFGQHRNRSAAEYYESIKTGGLPEPLRPTPSSIKMEIDEGDMKPETAKATAEFVTGLMEESKIIGRPLVPSDVRMEAVVQGFRPNSGSVNRTHITLQNGSQLLVAFEGNFLELSDRDREVVTHVSRLMQQYDDGRLTVIGHDDKPRKLGQRVKDAISALFG